MNKTERLSAINFAVSKDIDIFAKRKWKAMKIDAIAIANYFIGKERGQYDLTTLRLLKLVYLAHGFALAIYDKSLLNPKYDRVEAWKLGPVVPSVYHTFKHFKNSCIDEKGVVVNEFGKDGYPIFVEPEVTDDETKKVLDFVWNKFGSYTTSQLVDILHEDGTPWSLCYRAYENVEIPDNMTRDYYKAVVNAMLKNKRR